MAYNLNDSKQVCYFDKNKNKVFAKEIYYIGERGRYRIWPADVYITDIEIMDLTTKYRYDYSITNAGVPSYTRSGVTYSGLSPNVEYAVIGTIVRNQVQNGNNVVMYRLEDCYLQFVKYGDGSSKTYVWDKYDSSGTIQNMITGTSDKYGIYKCSESYVNDDNNVWVAPVMGYQTGWQDDTNGLTTVKKEGESADYGIRLKRTPITRKFEYDKDKNYTVWAGESIAESFTYNTSWLGPTPGAKNTSSGFTITNNNNSYFTVSHSGGKLTTSVKTNAPAGTYPYTISVTAYGKTDTLTRNVTITAPQYRVRIGTSTYNSGGSITLSEGTQISIERKSGSNAGWTTVEDVSLSSGNTSVVTIVGKTLTLKSSGSSEITVTDNEYGRTFKFTCISTYVPFEAWVKVTVSNITYTGLSCSSNAYLVSSNKNQTILIDASSVFIDTSSVGQVKIEFYEDSACTRLKQVYFNLYRGSNNSVTASPSNTITFTINKSTSDQEWIYEIGDSSRYYDMFDLWIKTQ